MKTLRGRLWLGFGGMLLILIAVSTLSVVVLTRYSHVLQQVFRENYDSAIFCDAMKDSLDRLDVAAQRLAYAAPLVPAEEVRRQTARFNENLHRQLLNVTLPGEKELTEQLALQWQQYQQVSHELESVPPDRRAGLYRETVLPKFQQIKHTAQQVADMNMANMVSVDGQARKALIGVRNAMLVLVSAGTLLAALLVGAVGATIVRPVKKLGDYARQIGTGNLDLAVEVRSADELGQLADAFNAMARQLRSFRQRDHEKLDRAQRTTQLAIDSLPDAVLVIGSDRTVEIANRAAQTHFNLRPGTTVAQANLKWLSDIVDHVSTSGEPVEPHGYDGAIQLFRGGKERFLLPHGVPMLDAAGKPIGVAVILVDVTALHHADELKSGLVSTVSHELRTPLTALRMAIALLKGERVGELTSRQKTLVATADETSERLYTIIENLLNMSRIESGRAKFEFDTVAPQTLIEIALAPLRESFAQKQIDVQISVDPDTPMVKTDPNFAGYVLTNLLSNALKFTPAQGSTGIRVTPDPAGVTFAVWDTGPGIPPEHADRLFERFFRVPRKDDPPGIGLGLAIAKEIAEALQGRLTFQPRDPRGAEFLFTLPAQESSVTSATPAPIPSAPV